MSRAPWGRAAAAAIVVAGLVAFAPLIAPVASAQEIPEAARGEGGDSNLRLHLKPLPADARRVFLQPRDGGGFSYVIITLDGSRETLDPDSFARRLYRDNSRRSWLFRLLNITSPTGFWWVTLGLLGQVLFTGRMVLQWLVSERSKRSVVPVGFWWMSLLGASMLMVYFIWRRDIVGVLGQSTGWLIYVRNLWLIYRERFTRDTK